MQKTISVFVDESGDFGKYDKRCPYYIITMVFHDQANDIGEDLNKLNERLFNIGYAGHSLHTGPLLRSEEVYKDISLQDRKKILMSFLTFARKLKINYHTFIVPKSTDCDKFKLIQVLSKKINDFLLSRHEFFSRNDIIIYYDNGSKQVTQILASVFNSLNCAFRRIRPNDYRLFQVTDLFTTFELIKYKSENLNLSNSEKIFFHSVKDFIKYYYKKIADKCI